MNVEKIHSVHTISASHGITILHTLQVYPNPNDITITCSSRAKYTHIFFIESVVIVISWEEHSEIPIPGHITTRILSIARPLTPLQCWLLLQTTRRRRYLCPLYPHVSPSTPHHLTRQNACFSDQTRRTTQDKTTQHCWGRGGQRLLSHPLLLLTVHFSLRQHAFVASEKKMKPSQKNATLIKKN